MGVRVGSTVAAVVVALVSTYSGSIADHHVPTIAPAVHKVFGISCSTDSNIGVLLLEDLELVAQVRHLLIDLFLLLLGGLARIDVLG